MISCTIITIVSLVIGLAIKWIFNPYFHWKKQQKLAKTKQQSIHVILSNDQSIDYKDYKNTIPVDISIIIPAYNEENRLGHTLEETKKYFKDYSYEIIIVNDCSKDKTFEVAKQYMDQRFKIINIAQNIGKGGAVRLGMLKANGNTLLMMDADLATDLNDFDTLYAKLKQIDRNGLGLVAGSRNHLVSQVVVTRKWYRNFLMFASNFVVNQICGVKLKDTQCGFKLFTKNTAQILFRILHLERWAFDVELFMIAQQYKVPVEEIPVNWKDVEGSHLNIVEASITMARDFLLVRILYLLRIWKFTDDIML